ncbi:MAG: MazG nucleotide pyrophosphohydrolase domain-containing protein [Parachlamydiaceae bacterium]
MEVFNQLLTTIKTLLGPTGCPWDREQTLASMRSSLVEESYELIEAIDLNHQEGIQEELGDLVFLAFFLGMLAEKEDVCTLEGAVKSINEKLIRRHPHVFSHAPDLQSADDVKEQWDRLKQNEKKRESLLDRIPKNLPGLARADEVLKAMEKKKYPAENFMKAESKEMEVGYALLELVRTARNLSIEPEQALRKVLAQEEKKFREWEFKPVADE